MGTGSTDIPAPNKASTDGPETAQALERLLNSPDIDAVFADEQKIERDLPAYLEELLHTRGMRRIDAVHGAGLNETFGYQIFTGARNPSRDKVLTLCFSLGCNLLESQRMLWHAGASRLYARNRRDAIIIHCLEHGTALQQADEELFRFGEPTIGSRA